jgi:hypothetical protein
VEVITERLAGSVAGFDRPIEVYHKWWNGINVLCKRLMWCIRCTILVLWGLLSFTVALFSTKTTIKGLHNSCPGLCGSV